MKKLTKPQRELVKIYLQMLLAELKAGKKPN
jgi:hypothetical protein